VTENMALATRQPRDLTPQMWQMIESVAPAMHKSRLFGVTAPEQAAAIMLKGYELGLGLAASFDLIQVIQGKPGLSPRGALAVIHASGAADVKIERLTDTNGAGAFRGYKVWMRRRDSGFEYTASFTMEDARRAGLVKTGSGWEHYPENMCLWRAVGFCADVVVPDVIGGMKTADQLGADLDQAGDVVEGEWAIPAAEAINDPAPVLPAPTLEELVAQYGADAVLAANGGTIPATVDEVAALAALLGA